MDELLNCRLFLLDLDGTLYRGGEVCPGAIEFVEGLKDSGLKYIYLTNNSARAHEDYVNRLRNMGFPCESEDVFTSGMATAMYILEKFPGRGVYTVGTEAFRRDLEARGVTLTDIDPAAVVVSTDTELTFEKIYKATNFLLAGADFIGANPDRLCPMAGGESMPDCGSVCALLTSATGREPFYIGKPNRNMIDIISEETGIPNGEIACVGDCLYTDIAAAVNAEAVSVCVLSGDTTKEMLEASPVKPKYVFDDVVALGRYLNLTSGR